MSTSNERLSVPPAFGQVFADRVASAVAAHLALSPAASMPELAVAAGISRATLFRRFPSRAALVAELCEAALRAYVGAVSSAASRNGAPGPALRRVVEALAELAPVVGLLGLQPLEKHVEASLLTQAEGVEEELRDLVRRGQEAGDFRVEVDPEWVLAMLTWLMVAAADSVRLGRLTPVGARRHLVMTVNAAVARSTA